MIDPATRILITGGSGFFAQAMVRKLLIDAHPASRIGIYSRNEWNQATMRRDLNDDQRLRWFIGDVRDRRRLRVAMHGMRTVIHAAALKRIEVGEYNPTEMVRTNIEGTVNVIEAAQEAQVENAVLTSSDKACEPLNCYGATKLVAEKLFLAANSTGGVAGPSFAVARYGNVAGSTGSIIPIWRAARSAGERAPMTDPGCTRFWMTREDAVELVLYCVGRRDLTVPLLKAYRLDDLAHVMDVKTKTVGLGQGEKMHESMVGIGEGHLVSSFPADRVFATPLISHRAARMSLVELHQAVKEIP